MFRVIFTTFFTGIMVATFVLSLFLNSILALFDLVTIPVSTMTKLKASQSVMNALDKKGKPSNKQRITTLEKKLKKSQQRVHSLDKKLTSSTNKINALKNHHKTKGLNLSKNFVKRTSTKVSSSALSAITVGTAAVIATVTTLEAKAFCEDKSLLLAEENILYDTDKHFDHDVCFEMAMEDTEIIAEEVKKDLSTKMETGWQDLKNITEETGGYLENLWRDTKLLFE